ncbi:MAG: hypothetical protein ABIH20_00985 [Candidatus Diapherotrites archaeon]
MDNPEVGSLPKGLNKYARVDNRGRTSRMDLRSVLSEAIDGLSGKPRIILRASLDNPDMGSGQLAKSLGVSTEAIRQARIKGLKIIRKRHPELREYL